MNVFRAASATLLVLAVLLSRPARAADLIVSANDGKFVRVDGVSTYPQPAPSDSLAVIDASQFPPQITAVVEGVEHTDRWPAASGRDHAGRQACHHRLVEPI